YAEYQLNNPSYTGNLYIIPLVTKREQYLSHPYLMVSGEFTTLTTGTWNTIAQLPPNIGTESWQPPANLLLLCFVDEAYSTYHSAAVSAGFGGATIQPSTPFIVDYQQFLQTHPFFNSFQGVLYPVVQSLTGQ